MSGMVGASRSLLSSRLVSILIGRWSGHIISAFSRHKLSSTVCLSPPLAGSSRLSLPLSAVAYGARCLREQDTCHWVHPSWPNRRLQPILFAVFLFAYVVTVRGNVSILAAISVEPKLYTPMYYFLGSLSLLDIECITITIPPMLAYLLAHQCRVPYASCISQLFFFHLLASVDCHLLTAMAYDHYLAICQPLIYSSRMICEIQGALVGICYTISFTNALTHTVAVSMLDFCGPNVVNHFYCDLLPLFQLSCSSIHLNRQLLFVWGGGIFMGVIPMILFSVSYAHIPAAVLRITSAEGRKAFSTCGSHLTVVCIFYGTSFFSYTHLGSVSALDMERGIGILNTIFSQMLNPVIYSLQNPDVQGALKRVLTGKRPPEWEGIQTPLPPWTYPTFLCWKPDVGRGNFRGGLRDARKVDSMGQGRIWFALEQGERLMLK